LEEVGMGRYENTLIANGYNDTDFLVRISEYHTLSGFLKKGVLE